MIDGGIFLGRDPPVEIGLETDEILRRLEAHGAGRALAASFKAVYYDYREGNAETIEACARSDGRLLPMATINLVGYDVGSGYLEKLRDDGFHALALFPHMQAWDWPGYTAVKVAEQAAALGVAVQAGVESAGDLATVARQLGPTGATLLARWTKGGGYNNLPDMISLAGDYPNLLFDVSTITQSGGIEYLAKAIGADRLFFASSMPLTLEGAPYFMLHGARLSDRDRLEVEGGALARVLGLAADAAPASPHERWEGLCRAPKMDTHWHTGTWNLIEPRLEFAAMSEEFDRFNYRAVLSSSIRALNYDLQAGNAETLAHIESDPRVFGLIVINPYQTAGSLAEIEKYRDHPRFVGLKTIQDYYEDRDLLSLDHASYAPLLERAREIGWPVMAHPPGIAEVAPRYPEINFIAAHSTWNYWRYAQFENVYFDIATSTALRKQVNLPGLLAAVGEDRILFSCDAQLMNPAWTLGKIASAGFDDALCEKIFAHNALRAFPPLAQKLKAAA